MNPNAPLENEAPKLHKSIGEREVTTAELDEEVSLPVFQCKLEDAHAG